MSNILLNILNARENRSFLRQKIAETTKISISFSLNIPGYPKTNTRISEFFKQIADEIFTYLEAHRIKYNSIENIVDEAGNFLITTIISTNFTAKQIKEITENFGFDGYLCTKVAWHNGRLSGQFSSLNCINEEKVKRINDDIIKDQPARIVAFGNSKGDYAMFKMSDEYYFVQNGKLFKNYPLK